MAQRTAGNMAVSNDHAVSKNGFFTTKPVYENTAILFKLRKIKPCMVYTTKALKFQN